MWSSARGTRTALCATFGVVMAWSGRVSAQDPPPTSTADHRRFEALQRTFNSGAEVTRACLECHTEAAKQVRNTIHWTWEAVHPGTGRTVGKRHVVNSFCSNLATNEPRCTSCHNGYGLRGPDFDFADDTRVDCLSCHDTTGTYVKAPTGAGQVLKEATQVHGQALTPPDLGHVARNVGPPSRQSCGSCHFQGGGGDGSKHGDLDSSLIDPPYGLSVHMSSEGADMTCQTCHVTEGHRISGSRYQMVAKDEIGRGRPGERRMVATCEACHGRRPHPGGSYVARTLNQHGDRVACQTCHIPRIARGGVPTKVWWDWSKAGRTDPSGAPIHEYDEAGRTTYWSRWGEIRWAENLRPTYAWFDGTIRYTLPTDPLDPDEVVPINRLEGSPTDPGARIWPFKVMRGKQPYDPQHERLALMHLFGDDDSAFWKHLEWEPAIRQAMEAASLPFSGEIDFVETTMHWPITHMVAPAEDAVDCAACHQKEGILADVKGVYLPGRDWHGIVDVLGSLALGATILAVVVHAGLRVRYRFWRRRT